MATTDETNIRQMPTFSATKAHEQLAVMLRAEGKTYDVITNQLNAEYNLAYSERTLREWFIAGGRLEAAYFEYLDALADQSVREAKTKIKRLSVKAADTLDELLNESNAGNVRQQAAKTILGKYIPDRQVLIDESTADDLPDELADIGDEVVTGDSNGPKQVDDAPQGADADRPAGEGGSEALPPALLPEHPTPDGSGDTPT